MPLLNVLAGSDLECGGLMPLLNVLAGSGALFIGSFPAVPLGGTLRFSCFCAHWTDRCGTGSKHWNRCAQHSGEALCAALSAKSPYPE